MASARQALIKRLHQFPLGSNVEHGTLQNLAISAIVSAYNDHRERWIVLLPYLPKKLRKEICKRLLYKGQLDNDLFSLCVDKDTHRTIWDLRSAHKNFTDQSCSILARVKSIEALRLSSPSCSSKAMATLVQNFSCIRLFEVINTMTFDDSVLEKVATCCPTLEVLNVRGTNITDTGMISLGRSQSKLFELDISKTGVSATGIQQLSNGPVKDTLQLLRFNHCPKLGLCSTIRDIILSFPNLKDYSFDFDDGDAEEIDSVLNQLPEPAFGQNVYFNIPF